MNQPSTDQTNLCQILMDLRQRLGERKPKLWFDSTEKSKEAIRLIIAEGLIDGIDFCGDLSEEQLPVIFFGGASYNGIYEIGEFIRLLKAGDFEAKTKKEEGKK